MNPSETIESENLGLNFPPEVLQAIQEILPSDDPFDALDFDEIDYINSKFPNEQSLHHIDDVLDQMRFKLTSIEDEIRMVVRSLTNVEQDGRTSLLNAQEAIAQLFSRFQDIKERAAESENRVKEITRDIKQLDTAKKNLTTSITTLNHLQMLIEGVDKLSSLKLRREYGEIATLLQGVTNVLDHLSCYRHIPQVADLSGQVHQICKDLEKQILDDFHNAFHGPNSRRFAPTKELAEACLVVSVLDIRVKRAIIEDVIKTQLAEYEVLFAGGEGDGWLTKVELRRKWFLKTAIEFEKTLAAMFPPSWKVPARLAYGFCEVTHNQLTHAMNLRPHDVDMSSLLHAHKVMSELETLLAKKYMDFTTQDIRVRQVTVSSTNPFYEQDSGDSKNPFYTSSKEADIKPMQRTLEKIPSKEDNKDASPFIGSICKCFQPFLKVYLDHLEKRLGELIDKFAHDMKNYRFEHLDAEASNVVPCCGELFTVYKAVLVEYLKLGSGEGLVSFAEILQKYLREFGNRVLRASLPKFGANIPNIPKDLNMKELTAVLAQVQTLWKEGDHPKLTEDDIRRLCSVLVSAEYCEEMTARLETKLLEKMSGSAAAALPSGKTDLAPMGGISLMAERDLFHEILSQSIALLVTQIELQCENSLSVMPKMNWMLEQTADQSSYVTAVSQTLAASVPLIRHNLHTSRKYFTRFCDKLAASISNKFLQQVYKCRPINAVGCEQLLLDSHSLKMLILNIPVVGSKVPREPPQTYTRMVAKVMSRAEFLLQVIMGEYSSNEELIDKFHHLLPDFSMTDFQKVLEMRGVRDRAAVLELYCQRTKSLPGGTGPNISNASSPSKQSGVISRTLTTSPDQESSKIVKLERLLKSRRLIS